MKPTVPHIIPKVINPLYQLRVMGRLVRRVVKKPGAPPGTLVHTGEQKEEQVRVRFLDYDAEHLTEAELPGIEGCLPFKDSPTMSWVNVDGLDRKSVV